ncbi:MAG: ATP-dependent RNA helicase [Pedosphaera sp.]|nr:ATP-dependent RNA helicase [Pedosphaera sp.]
MPNIDLPIWRLHSEIIRILTEGTRLVVVAATGSGKTTQVPQMLLDAGLAKSGSIVVLQPRRVAARSVAARVAWERNCRMGGEVGYQIRFEARTGAGTKICFVTEGILLRWLQDDPRLKEVSVLVFDEFHERNLLSDVSLALAKQLQKTHRPDLRIVVMSATLEAEPVAKYLANEKGPAPVLVSEGRTFPVEVRWADYTDSRPMTERAAAAVEKLISAGERGDILVFMPGMGEIQATLNALRSARVNEPILLLPLHGDLQPEEQDRAFQASDRRKIIVATNVAETSITIDGVRHVVDSGMARVARYDAERGLQSLMIEDISRASADQRAGRAGRTASGTCWRLWTESGHLNRPERNTPEIQRADLAEVVLLLHSLGVRKAAEFDWLDRPDAGAVGRAEGLLRILGALDAGDAGSGGVPGAGDLTAIGRQMLRLPMHPRYSRMLVEASRRRCVPAAALCAALVSGRDLLTRLSRDDSHVKEARELLEGSELSDFYTLIRAQQFAKRCQYSVDQCRRYGIHAQTARLVEDTYRQFLDVARRERLLEGEIGVDAIGMAAETSDPEALPRCLLAGFVDQLAIRKDTGTLDCTLTGGQQGTLQRESVVQEATLMVVAGIREISGRAGVMTLLSQATAVQPGWLQEMFPQHMTNPVEHVFDRTHKRVAAIRLIRFLDLVIGQEHQRELDPTAAGRCLAEAFSRGWFELPQLGHEARQFISRVNLVSVCLPDFDIPPLDGSALTHCLARAFAGCSLVKEAQGADLLGAIRRHLPADQVSWIDELAPVWMGWPGGKRHKLTYADIQDASEPPEGQVKLVDALLATTHPSVCDGKVPVKVWLMLPDGKRLEATSDWPGWRARQFPKHRSMLQQKFSGLLWP